MWYHDTGAGSAASRLEPFHDSHAADEKVAGLLSGHEPYVPSSSSSSTVSHFMGRLGAGAHRFPTMRTISSRRSCPLPNAYTGTYTRMETPHDDSTSGSDTPTPSSSRRRGITSSQPSAWSHSLRRRPRRHDKSTGGPNDIFRAPVPLFPRFSYTTTTTNGHHDPSSGSSNGSLDTYPSSSNYRVPFPLMTSNSDESYPSPYSADAVAVFQALLDKGEAPFFDGLVKPCGIFEDQVRVTFTDATETTGSTSTSETSVRAASTRRRRGFLVPFRRRVSDITSTALLTLRKFPSMFHKDRIPPYFVDDDDDNTEYDIPCLAYITCLW